jgi:hypothetical protein
VPNVNDVVERELTSVGRYFNQMVVHRHRQRWDLTLDILIFFTDGSNGGVGAGFGVYHSGGPESSFCL